MIRIRLATFALLFLAGTLWAEEPDLCAATSTASDVQFVLGVKDGRASFQEGEVIPLALSFVSSTPNRYWIHSSIGAEYCLEPEVPDPLEAHFNYRVISGGGIFSWPQLSEKPTNAEATLNNRHRLGVGHYKLYAVNSDVWHPAGPGEPSGANQTDDGHVHERIRSNTIEFEVRPATTSWQHEQALGAVEVLSGTPKPDDAKHAAEILRFLDTRESVRELAKALAAPSENSFTGDELSSGLYESSYPQIALESIHKEIAASGQAVNGQLLETLIELEEDGEHAEPASQGDGARSDALQSFWKQQFDRRNSFTKAAIDEVVAALPGKTGLARAVTLNTVLTSGGNDPSLIQNLKPLLVASWKDLPSSAQEDLLSYRWKSIGGPEMLPILRSILAQSPNSSHTITAQMRDAALRHIYELDPNEGRSLIARELQDPLSRPSFANIRLLGPEEIASSVPQAVERIGHNAGRQVDFELLDRYAGPEMLATIQTAFEANFEHPACEQQTKMLRYFLRVAPDYGVQQVRMAFSARKDRWCYRQLLQGIGDQIPQAQQVAIEALDDDVPEVQLDAALALGQWGTPAAKDALFARLERLHREWSGRVDELRTAFELSGPGSDAKSLEQNLVGAIGRGNGWLCTTGELARLDGLAMSASEKQQVAYMQKSLADRPITIEPMWYSNGDVTFSTQQASNLTEDQLMTRFGMYPSGTVFLWNPGQAMQIPGGMTEALQEAEFQRIRTAVGERGAKLEKAASDPAVLR
jgi:hypothetical protein